MMHPTTPGPWVAKLDHPDVKMGGAEQCWQVLGQLKGFGTAQHVANCFHFPQSEANARQIAAIPQLITAAKMVLQVEEIDHRPLGACGPSKTLAFNEIRAAIKAATEG